MENILVIQSDDAGCQKIRSAVSQMGHEATCAQSLKEGFEKIATGSFAVVFLGSQLGDGCGVDGIAKIKVNEHSPEIVIVASDANPDEAERAIASGAWDYVSPPLSPELVRTYVDQILEYRAEKGLRKTPMTLERQEIIGSSNSLAASLDLLSQAAQSDVNVILCGETGTGKELFAKAIHANSRRSQGNFVVVDCTALPDTLVESVLFGHIRGAFTGAFVNQDGLVKQADQGTLFLDEIGELPLAIQKSFLRVIQEHRFRPVGGSRETTSDFRLVVATNRDLGEMVRRGHFREDLLFRLRSLVIELPPLRQRRDDIRELVLHYVGSLCQRFRLEPKGFSPDFWSAVTSYPWPGNIREMIQALEKTLLSARDEPILYPKHLPTYIRVQVARDRILVQPEAPEKPKFISAAPAPAPPPPLKDFHRLALAGAEKQYFRDLIAYSNGSIEEACRLSRLSRSRLYALLRKYQLTTDPEGK